MASRPAFAKFASVGALAVFAAMPLIRPAVAEGPAPIVPRETRVLLLAPLDATVDSGRLQPLRQQIIRLRQQYEFITRQFAVLGETMAAKAAAVEPALDLTRPDARGRETLNELARRTNSDWVVSLTVQEVKTDPSPDNEFRLHSTLQVRIWNARGHTWLADRIHVGRTQGGGAPGRLFIESVDAAAGGALDEILAAYPPVVRVSQDGSIVDYLAGQRRPFIGDPNAVFQGLKAVSGSRP
jgi:hypothetical protein